MLGQLGLYGDEWVVGEARKKFQAHVSNTSTLPADLRSAVYKTVVSQMSQDDEKTYDQMLKVSHSPLSLGEREGMEGIRCGVVGVEETSYLGITHVRNLRKIMFC